MSRPRRVVLGIALVLGALSSGCAGLRVRALQNEAAGEHVYSRPIEQVWPEVIEAVAAQGYTSRGGSGYTLVTEPREDSLGSGMFSSLMIQGKATDPEHCILRVFKKIERSSSLGGGPVGPAATRAAGDAPEEENMDPGRLKETARTRATVAPDNVGFSRDLEREWLLVQALEPQWASQITTEIERTGQRPEVVARPTQASSSSPFEDMLEAERAKKRLPPIVWIPATSGLVLVGGGVAFLFQARHEESRLVDGDYTIRTDADIRNVIRAGKAYEAVGWSLCGAGALSLTSAIILRYSGVGRSPAPAVSVVPVKGGAAAVLGGSF